MGIRPVFTNDKEAFLNCTTPKLNYSANRFADELYIKPQGLLYEKGIKRIPIKVGQYKNLPVFFFNDEQSDFPFDIFSAIFYLLTRYEEYLPYSPDRYERFQPKESIAFHHNFLDEPIVERWVDLFKDFLKPRFTDFNYAQHSFQYIPTIDVDIAFAFRHRGILLGAVLFIRDLLKGNILNFFDRLKVVSRLSSDPYDNFDFLQQCLNDSDKKPIFFFQVGKRGKFDKNISIKNNTIKKIVYKTKQFAEIGLHPSFASNKKFSSLEHEKDNLEFVFQKPLTKSRQHYIKLYFPRTFQNLLKICITEDYSMGYPDFNGFRAGTCTPYNFYDLTKEKETDLKIYPFQVIDASFKTYLKLSPEEAEKKILELRDKVKSVHGTFIIIWHNDTFASTVEGEKWRTIFLNLLKD